ncbi:MAG: cytochrome c [Deltaproteobacteria bacterium]|nr:MAG: cytochrome c [Deltaproteobacteria bacterium]TMQ14176.1 MAG: cytochrome c [Deltaproteobacteria bacterium]
MRAHFLLPALLIACHHEPAAKAPEPAGTIEAQIEQGKQLYVARCAKCHGDAGQGSAKAPPVVGKGAFPEKPREGAKRDVDFHTAADVFAWTSKHMPGDAPGSLSTDQYLAIFAFDLTANGIKLDKPLDGPAAQAIVLHP